MIVENLTNQDIVLSTLVGNKTNNVVNGSITVQVNALEANSSMITESYSALKEEQQQELRELTEANLVSLDGQTGTDAVGVISAKNYFVDYNDSYTALNPITLLDNVWTTLTNDGAGVYSNTNFLPPNTSFLNTATGALDFSSLNIGDSVIIRNEFKITPNRDFKQLYFRYSLGAGAGAYNLEYYVSDLTAGAGVEYKFNLNAQFIYLGDSNTKDNPIFLQAKLLGGGTLINNGTAIQILKYD